MTTSIYRAGLSALIGVAVMLIIAANIPDIGWVVGFIFGVSAAFFAYEVLARRAAHQTFMRKWRHFE